MIRGSHHTVETQKKMSEAKLGKTYEEIYGPRKAEAARKHISESMKLQHANGRLSLEARQKIGRAAAARWQDEDIRRRTIDGIKRAWCSPEYREKWLKTATLNRSTAEYRKAHSEMAKKAANTPDYKRKWEIIRKSKEYREKLSIAQRKAYEEGRRVPAGAAAGETVQISIAEIGLGKELKASGVRFQKQFRIPETFYRADFYISSHNLIVEVDVHPFHYRPEGIAHGKKRYKKLKDLGYKQLHLKHKSIKRGFEFCLNKIFAMIRRLDGK